MSARDATADSRPRAVRAAVVGGTGYGGMELLRLLLGHPDVTVTAITSRTESGPVAERHPHLRGLTDLAFTSARALDLARENDVVFFATPHGVAAKEAPVLLEEVPGVKVVDLSGDFRLDVAEAYEEHYGRPHPRPDWLGRAVYGAPECGRREALAGARLVANPGCHAHATLLALWPAARAGLVDGPVPVCSVTGSSGSGATPGAGTHHPERFGNFKAYKPLRHQHVPEVERALNGDVRLEFVPHSAPFSRGIHVTAFVPLRPGAGDALRSAYAEAYGAEPFVRLLDGAPELRAVVGSNFADVGLAVRGDRAVVMVTIDNLVKGMAGSAVQNLNIICGLEESTGLRAPGMGL